MTDCIHEVAHGYCKYERYITQTSCSGCKRYQSMCGGTNKPYEMDIEECVMVLQTIKVTARLSRTEQEAIDMAIGLIRKESE